MSRSAAEAPATHPSVAEAGRARRVLGPLLLAGGIAAATVALHLRDPHEAGSWGVCPLYAATGIYCPGCGGLRAVNDLTHGDIAAAASSNLLFVASVPVLLFLWGVWFVRRWRDEPTGDVRNPLFLTSALLALVAVFTVVRNVSFGSWLAP